MLLSIIIPLYNNKSYLADCLDSILAQHLVEKEYEVIIVNDGSTDGSETIAELYQKKYANFSLVNQTNKGNGIARETGLSIAKGAYIFFVDSDDFLVPHTLKHILSLALDNNLDVLRFSAKDTFDSFDPNEKPRFFEIEDTYDIITGLQFLAEIYYSPEVWRFIFKRSIIVENEIAFISDHFIQDSFYTPMIYLSAKRTIHTKLDVYRYRQNRTSVTKRKTDAHIKKYVNSIEFGIEKLSELRKNIPLELPYAAQCDAMLKTKQQWYCVLFIIRFARSSNDTQMLNSKLNKMKALEAFPLKELKGGPYDSFKYSVIRFVFNHKSLRNIFTHAYRKYYQITK
ncbi:glycosyltransferase [Ascidiimonas sp. W6]|uniref:glycosyltransferase n=1 Tax=Ascidiimonas meishanensis TaxID=3128903 RepID=UPI0030ED0BD2